MTFSNVLNVVATRRSTEPWKRCSVVTGGGGGLGGAVARLLAEAGVWRLDLVDKRVIPLDAVVTDVTAAGSEAFAHAADLSDAEVVEGVIPAVIDRFGRVDALINTAAIFSCTRSTRFKGL